MTEAMLIEIGNSLSRSNSSAAVTFIKSLYSTHNINVIPVENTLLHRVINLYQKRDDEEWGLTDYI